jgi:hypothetical protein
LILPRVLRRLQERLANLSIIRQGEGWRGVHE